MGIGNGARRQEIMAGSWFSLCLTVVVFVVVAVVVVFVVCCLLPVLSLHVSLHKLTDSLFIVSYTTRF